MSRSDAKQLMTRVKNAKRKGELSASTEEQAREGKEEEEAASQNEAEDGEVEFPDEEEEDEVAEGEYLTYEDFVNFISRHPEYLSMLLSYKEANPDENDDLDDLESPNEESTNEKV